MTTAACAQESGFDALLGAGRGAATRPGPCDDTVLFTLLCRDGQGWTRVLAYPQRLVLRNSRVPEPRTRYRDIVAHVDARTLAAFLHRPPFALTRSLQTPGGVRLDIVQPTASRKPPRPTFWLAAVGPDGRANARLTEQDLAAFLAALPRP